jgi:hypothetical protein
MKDPNNFLSDWRIEANVPATFSSQVWRRIEGHHVTGFNDLFSAWIARLFARRAFVIAYATSVVALGLLTGNFYGAEKAADKLENLQANYVRSVDPYAPSAVK